MIMLKAGLIGCGNMGGGHLGNYYRFNREGSLLQLTCVCDIRRERLDLVRQDTGEIRLYEDLDTMLANEELDMVTIALPTYLHKWAALKCFEHGIHVLCEKPMALTVEDCDEMIAAAKAAGKQLLIGQVLRFEGNYQYLKKLVDEKTYGDVVSVRFTRSSSASAPMGWNNWFLTKELSGGGLYDLHIHDADMLRCVLGNPRAVTAMTRSYFEGSKNDAFAGIYHYDNIVVCAESDWSWKRFPFTADFMVNFERASLELHRGVLRLGLPGCDLQTVDLSVVDGIQTDNPYYSETKYLAECVRDGVENTFNPAFESRETIRLLHAIEESGDNGGKTITF
ncbi:MAG: Gfo/Idh/MocA family oxidoreductase [Ruminococcaceae bacterium]|nr:Gfo/Idh/MocA family oxidoreductase [Oscillospiraceae bacterium]